MNENFLAVLNSQQRRAVIFKDGPLLILAGAGSGKTKVLTYRAAYLISKKRFQPEEILLLTFTNKAAGEMKQRIKKLLNTHHQATSLPFAGTFHAFCARFLRREGKVLTIPPDYVIYDEQDQLETVKTILKEKSIDNFKPAAILEGISQAKNELLSPSEYAAYARSYFTKTVAQIYLEYEKILKTYHALDFDDLLMKTVNIFKKDTNLLKRYQNLFPCLLIDEYQDTNHAQYELTRLLAKRHQNLTVVGDCSQSIYSWRGADFRNVLKLKQDFPNLTTLYLERNYRSYQNILTAAFTIISKNQSHPILKLWTNKKAGPKITLYEAKNEKDEAEFIIKKIKGSIYHSSKKRACYKNFAVLYRTNAQSRVVEETLLHAGIPYILVGGIRFYERKEIKDCLAFLRLLYNPADKTSQKRIEKLGKRKWQQFREFNKNYSLKNKKTVVILDAVLKATHYLETFDEKNENDLMRLENIKELRSVATQFAKLEDFLENVSLIEHEQLPKKPSDNKEKNAVTLMTLHAAKGLEFKTVFIIGMEEGLFPHSRSFLDRQELEEERRLCYVGITRAKEKLYLTYTSRRLYFGTFTTNEISRFITDLPKDLIVHEYSSLLT